MSARQLTPGETLAARARAIACARAQATGLPWQARSCDPSVGTAAVRLFADQDGGTPWTVAPSSRVSDDDYVRLLLTVGVTLVRYGVPHPEEAGAR